MEFQQLISVVLRKENYLRARTCMCVCVMERVSDIFGQSVQTLQLQVDGTSDCLSPFAFSFGIFKKILLLLL